MAVRCTEGGPIPCRMMSNYGCDPCRKRRYRLALQLVSTCSRNPGGAPLCAKYVFLRLCVCVRARARVCVYNQNHNPRCKKYTYNVMACGGPYVPQM